jgi:hypothetical protein
MIRSWAPVPGCACGNGTLSEPARPRMSARFRRSGTYPGNSS